MTSRALCREPVGLYRNAIERLTVIAAVLSLTAGPAEAALPFLADDGGAPTVAPMLKRVTPGVVNVATEGRVRAQRNPLYDDPFFRHFFGVPDQPRERKTQSLGSGVVVDAERGLILTNAHVVANADQITVKLRDGRKLQAKRLGADKETDIAVIKVPAERLTALPLGDSDRLEVGDFVVAIGNPFGLGQTVTSGIVSALGRTGLGIEGYEDFIQTDASINPGNSGGALVDFHGRLVGINTAIFSGSGGSVGIGFAIPINMARGVMNQLVEHGEIQRGYLGVQLQDLDPELAEAFELRDRSGAVIVSVLDDSPAQAAGLKAGDVVVALNGSPVTNASVLRNRVGLLRLGDTVTLTVLRKGLLGRTAENEITARLVAPGKLGGGSGRMQNERLEGASFGEITRGSPAFGEVEGVAVTRVKPRSRAWNNGLRSGDIVLSVNRVAVTTVAELTKLAGESRGALLLHVLRGNNAAFIIMR
ncbi:MAG: Do family serine endopeptidase [Gammaproteobacteria bacterium]